MTTAELPLTALDRCDRCGAQAYVRTLFATEDELLWCAHHYRLNADRLSAAGATIARDDRSALDKEETS
jgi:acetyl-CoA carboxylase beta subunit